MFTLLLKVLGPLKSKYFMLNNLEKTTQRKGKRVGRGIGSGKGGHTSTRGNKGQKSRSGANIPAFFEGGQIPLMRRLPQKRGVGNGPVSKVLGVNILKLSEFSKTDIVTPELLLLKSIIKKIPKHGVKILSMGEAPEGLTLKGFKYSKKAQEKLIKCNCKLV